MSDTITVDKLDAGIVKTTLDETAKLVLLQSFKYIESNKIVDIRLGLCALPVLSALVALIYDYMYPYPASEPVLRVCVYSYFALIIVLTLFSSYVEPNTIMIGHKFKKGVKKDEIKLMSTMKRFDDKYTLTVERKPGSRVERTCSVGDFFDVNGTFLDSKFQNYVWALLKSKNH